MPTQSSTQSSKYFNPLPPQGGRHPSSRGTFFPCHFNPLPPQGGRLQRLTLIQGLFLYFNPLPPQGGRQKQRNFHYIDIIFQSTPSPRRETDVSAHADQSERHFNPLPPQGGRHNDMRQLADLLDISIHSLPKEGDSLKPYAPSSSDLFQSTPSPRRETVADRVDRRKGLDFNPLPPQGGRHTC